MVAVTAFGEDGSANVQFNQVGFIQLSLIF
jgi:hypothetical protein